MSDQANNLNVSICDDATDLPVTTSSGISGTNKLALDINVLNVSADTRFDPNDANPDYIGMNYTKGAATSGSTWTIFKFIKSGGKVVQVQQLANIAWDNRTTAF